MFDPAPADARRGLLLSLLLGHSDRLTAIFIPTLTPTERELAMAIRALRAACGEAAPELEDIASVAWIVADRPGANKRALPGTGASGRGPKPKHATFGVDPPAMPLGENGPFAGRRLTIGKAQAGWKPVARRAHAPPSRNRFVQIPTLFTALGPAQARPPGLLSR